MADDLDPFGRKKEEDPLAALGWSSDESASSPAAETSSTGTPSRERPRQRERERPRQTPREPRPRGDAAPLPGPTISAGVRVVRRLVVLAVLVAIGASVLPGLIDRGSDKADRFVHSLTTPGVPSAEIPSARRPPALAPAPAVPAARTAVAPRGIGRGSLLRPYAFGAARKRLRNGGLGRLTHLRVAPERIDATLLTKAGALRQVQIVPGGGLQQLGTGATGFGSVPTMSLAGIDVSAPQRLTRSAAERLGLPASRVNYLVYSQFAGTVQWNVYFTGGQIFSADAHGAITRRIS